MREVLSFNRMPNKFFRITPAYAGSTFGSIPMLYSSQDHPRVCGKYLFQDASHSYHYGSPPRMREVRYGGEIYFKGDGITPAYAGSTENLWVVVLLMKDHPRVCGKYLYT